MTATNKIVRDDHNATECRAVTELLGRIGDKWSMQVIGALSFGKLRYSEIQRNVDGISQRMLTLSLKSLEEDGLVERTVYPTIPPRVDYELTDLGRTLIEPLRALHEWTMKNSAAMLEARRRYAKSSRGTAEP